MESPLIFGVDDYLLIIALGFASSIISSSFGLLGGASLLLGLSFFYDFPTAMFLHGVIQLSSALSRVIVFKSHLKPKLIFKYFIGVALATMVISMFIGKITSEKNYILLSVLIVSSVHFDWSLVLGKIRDKYRFVFVGSIAGFLGPIVGVVGPIITPVFLKTNLSKEEFVVNKTTCQSFVHISKVALFYPLVDLQLNSHSGIWFSVLILAMFLAHVMGRKFLSHISKDNFEKAVKAILYLIAITFVFKAFL